MLNVANYKFLNHSFKKKNDLNKITVNKKSINTIAGITI